MEGLAAQQTVQRHRGHFRGFCAGIAMPKGVCIKDIILVVVSSDHKAFLVHIQRGVLLGWREEQEASQRQRDRHISWISRTNTS